MNAWNHFFRTGTRASIVGTLAYMLFGPLTWAVQLTLVYGGHTLTCATGGGAALADWIVIAVSLVAALVVVVFLLMQDSMADVLGLAAGHPRT